MTARDLERLIGQPDEAGAPGLTRAAPGYRLLDAWRAARNEASNAYDVWRRRRDAASFAVYRAAEDRADAAMAALRAVSAR